MPFKPGKSGNPNGRPKKERTLTAILEQAGAKSVQVGDKGVSGKHLVARMVWEGMTTGTITFPDKTEMKLKPYYWLELVKWMYAHVDGPPRAEMDVSQSGEMIIRVVFEGSDDNAAEVAPGAGAD